MTIWHAVAHRRAPVVVGHRGGRGEGWPAENSLAAFERARTEGAAAVETDARLAATGEVVLWHDPEHRGTRIAHTPLDELARRGIARLDDALAWARERGVALNVELKRDLPAPLRLARSVARVLRHAGAGTKVDVLVSSFDPALVGAMAGLLPSVPRAWLLHARHDRVAIPLARAAFPPLVHAIHPERSQALRHASKMIAWRSRGLAVGVYTVNDVDEARRLAALSVDWIFTDAPRAMTSAFAVT